jgi:hypothetical protein
MMVLAEIQKRQQSVCGLKRQVEQISTLGGEGKKAGIRVADAHGFRSVSIRFSIRSPSRISVHHVRSNNGSLAQLALRGVSSKWLRNWGWLMGLARQLPFR